MTDKPTMADVWEELSLEEKQKLSALAGVDIGVLALTKISTVLKQMGNSFNNCEFANGINITGDTNITNCHIEGNITIAAEYVTVHSCMINSPTSPAIVANQPPTSPTVITPMSLWKRIIKCMPSKP